MDGYRSVKGKVADTNQVIVENIYEKSHSPSFGFVHGADASTIMDSFINSYLRVLKAFAAESSITVYSICHLL